MRVVAVAIATGVIAILGVASAQAAGGGCLVPGKAFVTNFKPGVKSSFRARLGPLRAVRSRGEFGPFPRSLQKGVYFVSAKVPGVGTATWAVSADSYAGGGGVIFGAETVSRKVSTYGVDIGLGVLKGWGIAPSADGFAKSRACLK
jgi:hypothetical protein